MPVGEKNAQKISPKEKIPSKEDKYPIRRLYNQKNPNNNQSNNENVNNANNISNDLKKLNPSNNIQYRVDPIHITDMKKINSTKTIQQIKPKSIITNASDSKPESCPRELSEEEKEAAILLDEMKKKLQQMNTQISQTRQFIRREKKLNSQLEKENQELEDTIKQLNQESDQSYQQYEDYLAEYSDMTKEKIANWEFQHDELKAILDSFKMYQGSNHI